LHGKKEIFLENIDYSDKNEDKETEANNFAVKWTLSKEQEEEILRSRLLTETMIVAFAEKFNTHPAIIIGRLQYHKKIPYTLGNQFFVPVILRDI
jgi:hypothetical protein